MKENYQSECKMPIQSSKMIVEVRISDKLCDTNKDHRLSKEMICYQLGKRLDRKLDTKKMTVLIRVFKNMENLVVVNMHNHDSFRLYKEGADSIRALIANELGGYIENPSKKIAENQADDTKVGGPLYALLRNKGAALENKSTGDESRYELDAKTDYKERCAQYKAFRLALDLSKQLKNSDSPYSLIVSSEENIFRPKFCIQLMRYDKPCMWFPVDTDSWVILDTINFIEGITAQTYINTFNGVKLSLCEMLNGSEYMDDYRDDSLLLNNSLEYDEWANPRIKGFLNTLKAKDDEDNADGASDDGGATIKCYEDNAWIELLGNTIFRLFTVESNRAKSIILTRLLSA